MLYRVVRAINRSYFYVMFGVYVVAFFTAFGLMFIPIVTIAILLISLYSLVFVIGIARVIAWLEQTVAKRAIQSGRCPSCRLTIDHDVQSDRLACPGCKLIFLPSGITLEQGTEPEAELSR